jgi:carboxyl-terminal processing protease
MKKLISIVAMTLVCLSCLGQDKQQIKNLSELCKVWGLLKYYHPAYASGKIDADQHLLEFLEYSNFASKPGFDNQLINWYNQLPAAKLSSIKTQPTYDSLVRVVSVKDIQRIQIPVTLKNSLVQLFDYHIPDTNVFVTDRYQQYVLDYALQTEDTYDDAYPNKAMRLLALFRYWNVINYFYPHQHQTPLSWHKVLPKYIPLMIGANSAKEYRYFVKMLSTEIEDSHSFYEEPEEAKNSVYGPPFGLKSVANRYFISYLYANALTKTADYQLGDEVLKINGRTVREIAIEMRKTILGSNKNSTGRELARMLFRTDTVKQVEVLFKRRHQLMVKLVKRLTFAQLSKGITTYEPQWKKIKPTIHYLNVGLIRHPDTLNQIFRKLNDSSRVILDMRIYPNYNVAQKLLAMVIRQPLNLGYDVNANVAFPGTFTRHVSMFHPDTTERYFFTGKIVVLVSEDTQSLGETISASLRHRPNTVIMGSQTAGTTGNMTKLSIPGAIKLGYTAVGTEGRNKSFVQKDGVKIDIKVKTTLFDVQNGIDKVLVKAINYLDK